MATAAPSGDYFSASRPTLRSRLASASLLGAVPSPGSPRTPLLDRSLSSQFGSPGSFRVEHEDTIVYELGARHLSAGFAGESRPRCRYHFDPENERRLGDYRAYDPKYSRKRRKLRDESDWGKDYELHRTDLRGLDLGLVEDKLERAVRTIHVDHLQLDQKPKKAVLAVPSLFPTPLLEIAMKVLFNHHPQLSFVTILTAPLLACVGAGVRNALVIDVGWEEAVIAAVGEYKEVLQRRSVRAGRMLTRDMARMLRKEAQIQSEGSPSSGKDDDVYATDFQHAEDVTQRMAWCRPVTGSTSSQAGTDIVSLPICRNGEPQSSLKIPFDRLADPTEAVLFRPATGSGDDDHDQPLHILAYRVLRALPLDFRAVCISRIVLTGGLSHLPGLKSRLLQEIAHLVEIRGWDPVEDYGSAQTHRERILRERSVNTPTGNRPIKREVTLSPTKKPIQEDLPHGQRIHDDTFDPITLKAEREAQKGQVELVKMVVRGVDSLGAWAGASLMASLRVKGVHEIERDDHLKNGLREVWPVI